MSGVAKMESIIVNNASENNLKNVSVSLPLNAFTCVTGPSGCGKSSLIFDTVYAESQRNFLESMSGNLYGQKLMDKPKVESIENLRPALNVSQTYYNVNPRSTIGTVTDISYYLRALYALYAGSELDIHVDSNYFSGNNPSSCCKKCKGLGEEYVIAPELVIPDDSKTLAAGGILYYKGTKTSQEYKLLEAICENYGIDINSKVSDLKKKELDVLLYRKDDVAFDLKFKTPKGRYKAKTIHQKGAIVELEEKLEDIDTPSTFANISKYLKKALCTSCGGSKLKKSILDIKIDNKNIADVEALPFDDLLDWLNSVEKKSKKMAIKDQVAQLIFDVKRRVECLIALKLEYLCLGRNIPSLSGGEVQRVRLANQLSCSLSGILYILDEPCKGLHYKNINSVIDASKELVKKGNTVISIEHNKQYIAEADKIIELGPVGGPEGGYITSETSYKGKYKYDIKFKEIEESKKDYVSFYGIKYHNLNGVDVSIPTGSITCISGVSGSGKSTLTSVISECCEHQKAIYCTKVDNISKFKKIQHVNQQPIGKTPRSTVVSYLGVYDKIREKFASQKDAKKLGLTASDFSMNVEGGRCENCQGTGKKKIELTYMPDSYIECPECHGKRFHEDVLSVKFKDNNINDILDKPLFDIIDLFEEESIHSILKCMIDIGMGYVSLGQMSMSLSGGEAQRIKLAKCLGAKATGKNLYVLDEPTSGLNEVDITLLKNILLRLSEAGETILIIEHNIEFIAEIADYLVDLGIDAGNKGGTTVVQGTPKKVCGEKNSSWYGFK